VPENLLEERQQQTAAKRNKALAIQPNPAGDWAIITFPTLEDDAELSVTDSWGRTVHRITLKKGGQSAIQLPVANFANGLYTVLLTLGSGKLILLEKMIVAH
jgi:hypothetical protein